MKTFLVRVSRHPDENVYRVYDPDSRSTQLVPKRKAPALKEALVLARSILAIATINIDGRWCRLDLMREDG